jgi:hypothetical protein
MKKAWGQDLYIIAAGPELTKLGRSQHPQKRLQEISPGMPFQPCSLFAVFPDAGPMEAALHRELALGHEKRGEWYRCSAETVAATVVRRLGSLEGVAEDP